jgi:hypothetical protein
MKKLFLIVFLISGVFILSAKSRSMGISFGGGIAQGYGSRDQAEEFEIAIKIKPVYRAGVFSLLSVSENLRIHQEVLFTQKGSLQEITHKEEPVNLKASYDLDYLEVPFLIQQKLFQVRDATVWGTTGFSFSWLLQAQYDLDCEVCVGDEVIELNESHSLRNLDEFDYSLLYGLVLDFSIFQRPVILEYRFSLGWYKIDFPTYGGLEPVQLCNQVHSITLGVKLLTKE